MAQTTQTQNPEQISSDQTATSPVPVERTFPRLRIEHLWILVSLSAAGFLLGLSRTIPNDFWWHLKAGELIATQGLPTTNIFAWTLPADAPFVYQSWLGEWLYFQIYQLGGLQLVVFTRNMLGLAMFALVGLEAERRSGSWRLAAGAVLLVALMTINNWTTRTQNWSWVPFALVLYLLGRYSSNQLSPRWLLLLPLLMIFWVNAHGGFMMGILVTGAYVVGETLRRLLKQPYALTWDQLRPLYIAAVAMGAVTVINPLGVGVFAYVYDLLTDAPSQDLIIEWQPPDPQTIAGLFFVCSILLVIAAFGLGRRRPTITDILLVCGLGWMALNGVRYVVWFGVAALPIVAYTLSKPQAAYVLNAARDKPRRRGPGGSPVLNAVAAGILVLIVVLIQPWFKPFWPWPDNYREAFAPVPGAPLLFSDTTPVGATQHLQAEPCDGNLFNEMGYGSYLIWEVYPEVQVFVDPRVELFPLDLWENYIMLTRGEDVPLLLQEYTIDCVMLDLDNQPRLAEELATLPGWQRTYEDSQSEVWRRVGDA